MSPTPQRGDGEVRVEWGYLIRFGWSFGYSAPLLQPFPAPVASEAARPTLTRYHRVRTSHYCVTKEGLARRAAAYRYVGVGPSVP